MAALGDAAILEISTLLSATRRWTATPSAATANSGAALTITVAQSVTGGVPPSIPDTLTIDVIIDDGSTVIRSYSVTPADTASDALSFNFTVDGVAASAARAGTVKIKITAVRTSGLAATQYAVNSDNSPADTRGTGNTETTTARAKGAMSGKPTVTTAVSNISLGGGKTTPADYNESLFVRTTLGATLYTARVLTLTVPSTTPSLTGTTPSQASGNFDATFSNVVDNRFPVASTSIAPAVSVATASLTGAADFTAQSSTLDSITVDPRLTVTCQAQKVTPRTGGGNVTSYVISADQLFIWSNTVSSRSRTIGSITMQQRLLNGASVVATDSTAVTAGGDGWTPSAGINFTTSVAAPAGNRTQDATPSSPAKAIGLGTGTQTLGFASAYTANRSLVLHADDEVPVGEAATLAAQFVDTTGARLAFDAAPTLRIYSINTTTGAETDELAAGAMTIIGATNAYKRAWTPAAAGLYIIEVRAQFSGGGVQGAWAVTVRPRFDGIALALGGQLVSRM